MIGRRWEELGLWADTSERDEAVRRLRTNGSVDNLEFTFRKKNGDVGKGLISADLIEIDGNPCAITATIDITEHRQLEDQLAQALRLDSIGRLASGVAHDFNNFLMVIAADSDFLLESIGPNDPLRPHVDGITKATEHAASLTKNLLAFGRKQVIKPKQLDLNKIISDSVWMMQRLVGKDIGIATRLDPLLGQVDGRPRTGASDPHESCIERS